MVIKSKESDIKKKFDTFFKQLKKGDIVLLSGPIGAGKTTFVRQFVESMEDLSSSEQSSTWSNSPSYNLIHEYNVNDHKILHIDLYRIQDEEDLESTGFWDIISRQDSIAFIEWPEKINVSDLNAKRLIEVHISEEKNSSDSERHYHILL